MRTKSADLLVMRIEIPNMQTISFGEQMHAKSYLDPLALFLSSVLNPRDGSSKQMTGDSVFHKSLFTSLFFPSPAHQAALG